MRECGAVLKGVANEPERAQRRGYRAVRTHIRWQEMVRTRRLAPLCAPTGQLRAGRAGPLEFFHCPMLSVMIFTEASAAWVACA
jgi:hypothetical protein